MKTRRIALCASVLSASLTAGLVSLTARASDPTGTQVSWARIVGIVVPQGIVGRPATGGDCVPGIDCVLGTPAAWTVTSGIVTLDLEQGRLNFEVRGLVLADDPSFTNIGTRGTITRVKGTLVCNDTEPGAPELVDTDAVALSPQGNARFSGLISLPPSCTDQPRDIVFLIRIAEAEPDFLVDRWNAFGAVRRVIQN